MLVIVHKSLLDDAGAVWDAGRKEWLYLDTRGLLHEGRPDVSGRPYRAVLAERLAKSTRAEVTVNPLIIVTPNLGAGEVQELLKHALDLPREDYWLDVGIVTACEASAGTASGLDSDCAKDLLARDQNGRMRSVWMIGRIDSTKEQISPDSRREALDYVLQMLSQGGENWARSLGIIPDQEGQRHACRICAWGFRSFMPGESEVEAIIGQEFRKSIAGPGEKPVEAGKTLAELMQMKADGFLKAGLQLDLAFEGQSGGDVKPWRDTLPLPPETPLRNWRCRILGTGEEMAWIARGLLRRYELVILQYYADLLSFLKQQAQTIRLKGQDRLAHISQDARLFIMEEKRPSRLSAALRHFFPTFYVSSAMSAPVTACPKEHDPSRVDVVRTIVHGMVDKSADRCRAELLNSKSRFWLLLGSGLAAVASAGLLRITNWDPMSLAPLILALFVIVIVDVINRRKFNRIKSAMNAEIEKEQAHLRGEFVRKVEWVLEKTGLTVQTQVIADMTALEGFLRRKVDFLAGVGVTSTLETSDQAASGPEDGSGALRLAPDTAEQIRDRISETAKHIVSLDENAAEIEWDRVLDEAKRQIVTMIEPPPPSNSTPLDERLAGCCRPEQPPFLAQYDGVFNQRPYAKVFCLPRNTPHEWVQAIERKANCGDQQVLIHKGDFKGASVVVRYDGLRVEQLPLCFDGPGAAVQG